MKLTAVLAALASLGFVAAFPMVSDRLDMDAKSMGAISPRALPEHPPTVPATGGQASGSRAPASEGHATASTGRPPTRPGPPNSDLRAWRSTVIRGRSGFYDCRPVTRLSGPRRAEMRLYQGFVPVEFGGRMCKTPQVEPLPHPPPHLNLPTTEKLREDHDKFSGMAPFSSEHYPGAWGPETPPHPDWSMPTTPSSTSSTPRSFHQGGPSWSSFPSEIEPRLDHPSHRRTSSGSSSSSTAEVMRI